MILQCPACNAKYAVPDHAIGAAGRTVKCTKCAHQWFVAAPRAASATALEELLKTPDAPQAKAIAKESNVPAPPSKPSLLLESVFFGALLLALVTTMFAQKPGWFGFARTQDLTLAELTLAKQVVERGMEYAVKGKLVNSSNQAQAVPVFRITLVDKEGTPLQYWPPAGPEKINANTELPFTFGPLKTKFTTGHRLVVEIGNPLELALRRKP